MAGTCGHREHTFPRKRIFTTILSVRRNLLHYKLEVGRLGTELSRQVSVYASILENDSVSMPPTMPLPNGGCPWMPADCFRCSTCALTNVLPRLTLNLVSRHLKYGYHQALFQRPGSPSKVS